MVSLDQLNNRYRRYNKNIYMHRRIQTSPREGVIMLKITKPDLAKK